MRIKKIDKSKIKTWFITGASSGVGKELCLQLLERNYNVIAISRRKVNYTHKNLISIKADVTKPEEINNAIQTALERFDKIDVLVNCAGVSAYLTVEEETDFREVMETNFWGAYNCIKLLLPLFRKNKNGTIVNCTSKHGLVPRAFGGAYCASKYALEGLSNSLRLETKNFLRVMTFQLGYFPGTAIGSGKPKNISQFDEYKNVDWIPIKHSKNFVNNLSAGIYYLINEIEKEKLQYHLMLGGDCIEETKNELKILQNDLLKSKKRAYACERKDIIVPDRTDYLILNLWNCTNYGTVISAWAMQELVKSFGFNSLLLNINNPFSTENINNSIYKNFTDKWLNISKTYFNKDLKLLSKNIKGAILGSGPVLNMEYVNFFKYIFLINWAESNVKKIALSASFGSDKNNYINSENFTADNIKYFKSALQSFDYLSCREISGIEIYKDIYDLNSDFISDPILLIDKDKYNNIIQHSKIDNVGKIAVYILDMDNETATDIKHFSENKKNELVFINDKLYSVEDWLKSINECKLFITDSFYGVCFAIIFNKPFICLNKKKNLQTTFDSLIQTFDIKNNFVYSFKDVIKNDIKTYSIDYCNVNNILEEKKSKDLEIIRKVLIENYTNNPKSSENKIKNQIFLETLKPKPINIILLKMKYYKYKILRNFVKGEAKIHCKKQISYYKYLIENISP